MKRLYLFINTRLTCIIFFLLFITSCDEKPPASAPAIQHPDSLSVKRMDADSNSDMPVAIPKDSSVTMPNPYDGDEKPPPIK